MSRTTFGPYSEPKACRFINYSCARVDFEDRRCRRIVSVPVHYEEAG